MRAGHRTVPGQAGAPRARLRASIEALVWLVLGACLWFLSFDFDEPSQAYRLGAASWPRAVLVLMFVFVILQWLGVMRGRHTTKPTDVSEQRAPMSLALLAIFILPLVYAWLLPRAGFFATTPFFCMACFWLLGERNWWRVIVATVTLWLAILLVFSAFLYVPLPAGNWPGFYDFSNFVLALLR